MGPNNHGTPCRQAQQATRSGPLIQPLPADGVNAASEPQPLKLNWLCSRASCEAFQCLVLSGFSLCLSNQWSGRGGIKRPCKKGQVLSGKLLVDVPASIAPNCPQPGPNQLHVAKAHPDVCCKRSSPCGACMGTARPKAAASAICFTEHLACWHVRSHSQDLSSEA